MDSAYPSLDTLDGTGIERCRDKSRTAGRHFVVFSRQWAAKLDPTKLRILGSVML